MPKLIEYPRASLQQSLELAQAVYDLGGTCSDELCAEKLSKKLSGAFTAQASAALKYGFIDRSKGQLQVTGLFRDYVMAYSEDEAKSILKIAFLNIPIFSKIIDRFKSTKVPIAILEKLLVREFDVNKNDASRIAGHFISGAKEAGVMDDGGNIRDQETKQNQNEEAIKQLEHNGEIEGLNVKEIPTSNKSMGLSTNHYTVNFVGPGMNTTLEIKDEDDLLIVEAFLKKIKRNLNVAA